MKKHLYCISLELMICDSSFLTMRSSFTNCFLFRSFQTYNRTMNSGNVIDFDNIPLKLQIEDVSSNFVQMYFFLNTKSLKPKQKELLPLLLETWMSSPLIKDRRIIDIETVVKRRTTTLLAFDYYLGFSGLSRLKFHLHFSKFNEIKYYFRIFFLSWSIFWLYCDYGTMWKKEIQRSTGLHFRCYQLSSFHWS